MPIKNCELYITVKFRWATEKVKRGTSLLSLATNYQERFRSVIAAAKVNNDIKELSYKLEEDCAVEFIDLTNSDGIRIYQRSLVFVLVKACNDLYPGRKLKILHSLSKQGLYCEIEGEETLGENDIKIIEKRMSEITEKEIP